MPNFPNRLSPPLSLKVRVSHLAIALAVFYVLYPLTNSYSSALYMLYPHKVHVLVSALDTQIRFVPSMIVPYSWSLILFCASFFLVRTSKQLIALTWRLVLATVLAAVIFYLYPARFSFVRPETIDWTRFGYQFLSVTDKPFNQLPSLHVSFALLLGLSLWPVTHKLKVKTKEASAKPLTIICRVALIVICGLIIVSTVFTYQHHLLDIVGGIILSVLVEMVRRKLRNHLVLRYLVVGLTGFVIIAIAGFFIQQALTVTAFDLSLNKYPLIEYLFITLASYWLLSFWMVAWSYQAPNLHRDKRWFAKDEQGKLTPGSWFRFAPLLRGYQLMWSMRPLVLRLISNKNQYSSQGITEQLIEQSIEQKLTAVEKVSQAWQRTNFHPINSAVFTIATPKLSSASATQLIAQLALKDAKHKSDYPITKGIDDKNDIHQAHYRHIRIIVVDVCGEVSSHYVNVKSSLEQLTPKLDLSNRLTNKLAHNPQYFDGSCEYLYFPLLDLQSLAELDIKALLSLFKELDQLLARPVNPKSMSGQSLPKTAVNSDADITKVGATQTDTTQTEAITLINFHCVMGLSRSIAIETLYLLYCGKLTLDNYRQWINHYYPNAHISEQFLPASTLNKVLEQALKQL
ncbi:MAG: phosphatase PAP2 family protein [Psychrobacter sp.]|nr:phosphatase PAP2 family protein [Psychrobacter sp.]